MILNNRWTLLTLRLFVALVVSGSFCDRTRGEFLTVHIGYVVPDSRTLQVEAIENMRASIQSTQSWYREQMEWWGFGPKTFRFETENDGITPQVHLATTTVAPDTIHADIWGQTISAATEDGQSNAPYSQVANSSQGTLP